MNVYTTPPQGDLPGILDAHDREGLVSAEIRLRWPADGSPRDALRLLTRVALEVVCAVRAGGAK